MERGWISREEGEKRIIITLKTLRDLKRINGFWYHFIDPDTGKRGWKDSHNIELSNASAGTMLLGALAAAEYFGGEIEKLTYELYQAMNWKWFTNPVTKHPYLACYPEDLPKNVPHGINKEGMFGGWSAYSEHIFLYILSAGAPREEFSTGADSYYAMKTYKGSYKGETFIFCGSGAAFTYQWTHAFIDFRNLRDKLDRNWFDNSRHAGLAARQYAFDNAHRIKGLGPNSWGMSACISPSTGYSGLYGSHPIGVGHKLLEDGTVAPYGALSFLPFTPQESKAALEHMYKIPGLVGKYGLYAAVILGIILGNLQGGKISELQIFGTSINVSMGAILYSGIYFATDLLNEKFGKNEANRAVYLGFFANIAVMITLWLSINFLPSSLSGSALEVHTAISTLAQYSPIFIIGSLMAYLASQTFDVWFFNYLKEKTDGKKLWLRNNLSTMTSQLIDTLIYQFTWVIATDLTFAEAFGLAVVKYIFKFIIAIVDTVFIYIVRGWKVPE